MDGKYLIGSVGIGAVTILETTAIIMGVDGAYLSACVGAICGIVGAIAGVTLQLKNTEVK